MKITFVEITISCISFNVEAAVGTFSSKLNHEYTEKKLRYLRGASVSLFFLFHQRCPEF